MQVPNQYPTSKAMFPETVTPPAVSPLNDANPVTLGIDCTWWPYIVGAIKSLRQAGTWTTASELELITVEDYVDTLLEYLTQQILASCETIAIAFGCDYDFEAGEHGWEVVPGSGQGVWVSTIGYQSTGPFGSESQQAIYIRHVFDAPVILTHFEASSLSAFGGTGPNNSFILYAIHSDTSVDVLADIPNHADGETVSWSGTSLDVSELRVSYNSGELVSVGSIYFALAEGFTIADPCT